MTFWFFIRLFQHRLGHQVAGLRLQAGPVAGFEGPTNLIVIEMTMATDPGFFSFLSLSFSLLSLTKQKNSI